MRGYGENCGLTKGIDRKKNGTVANFGLEEKLWTAANYEAGETARWIKETLNVTRSLCEVKKWRMDQLATVKRRHHLMTALEALLNVLPFPSQVTKGKADEGGLSGSASDFDALERLRKLAFADLVPKTLRPFENPNAATVQAILFDDDEAAGDGGEAEGLDFGEADEE